MEGTDGLLDEEEAAVGSCPFGIVDAGLLLLFLLEFLRLLDVGVTVGTANCSHNSSSSLLSLQYVISKCHIQ